MGKVTITKAQAGAIVYLRETYSVYEDDGHFIRRHAQTLYNSGSSWTEEGKPLNGLDIATFSQAVLVGYEVERTPEETIAAYYISHDSERDRFDQGVRDGVKQTLKQLGVTIEGVND